MNITYTNYRLYKVQRRPEYLVKSVFGGVVQLEYVPYILKTRAASSEVRVRYKKKNENKKKMFRQI